MTTKVRAILHGFLLLPAAGSSIAAQLPEGTRSINTRHRYEALLTKITQDAAGN